MVVVPFPLVRRVAFTRGLIDQMLRSKPQVAENLLRVQRDLMLDKGIAPELADNTLAAFEHTVRTEYDVQLANRRGGAA